MSGPPTDAHFRHRRMRRRAAGNFFLQVVNAQKTDIEWTPCRPAHLHSSDAVRRGFCADCGARLTFETLAAKRPHATIGSLDDPASVKPATQDGVESRLPWLGDLRRLPEIFTDTLPRANHQHPDHDTSIRPPR